MVPEKRASVFPGSGTAEPINSADQQNTVVERLPYQLKTGLQHYFLQIYFIIFHTEFYSLELYLQNSR